MMYRSTFSSRSARTWLPRNIFLSDGPRARPSLLGIRVFLSCPGCCGNSAPRWRGDISSEPEHVQEGCVLTGCLERRTARDAKGAMYRSPPVVRERPSSARPEKGHEQE